MANATADQCPPGDQNDSARGLELLDQIRWPKAHNDAAHVDVGIAFLPSSEPKLAGDAGLNADKLSYGDLLADGVIDLVKVTRSAVLNAASVARMVLTTETAVVERVSQDEDDHAGHHHGHAH
jgi:chaperonin GroEL